MHKTALMDDKKKAVIWRERENGTPMVVLSRAIEKPPATIYSYLPYHGIIQPRQRKHGSKPLVKSLE